MQRIDHRRKKKKHYFPLVDGINVKRVKSTCILDLTIQDNMKWNEHIYDIV